MDDASRKVLSAGEFDNAIEENSLEIIKEAIERTSHMYPIMSIISDQGSQFYEHAEHAFELFLKDKGDQANLMRRKSSAD